MYILILSGMWISGCTTKYFVKTTWQEVDSNVCNNIIRNYSKITLETVDFRESYKDSCMPSVRVISSKEPFFSLMKQVKDIQNYMFFIPLQWKQDEDYYVVRHVDEKSFLNDVLKIGDTITSINDRVLTVSSKKSFFDVGPFEMNDTLSFVLIRNGRTMNVNSIVSPYKAQGYWEKKVGNMNTYISPYGITPLFVNRWNQLIQSTSIDTVFLDLRGNVGGVLHSVIESLSEIAPRGEPVVITENRRDGQRRYFKSRKQVSNPPKIIIFIDALTVSGAEAMADALQHYQSAILVGSSTSSSLYVSSVFSAGDGYGVMYPTGYLKLFSEKDKVYPDIHTKNLNKHPSIEKIYFGRYDTRVKR